MAATGTRSSLAHIISRIGADCKYLLHPETALFLFLRGFQRILHSLEPVARTLVGARFLHLRGQLIRLAYFNVTEEERQNQMSEHRAYYLGVPVTASAVLAPLFYLLSLHFSLNCAVVYALGLFLLGVLYITPIRVKKPQLRGVAFLSVFGLGEFAVLLRVLTR